MIRIKDVTIGLGDFRLTDINFEIPQSAYCSIMGKTGSGKTTLLETICGLKPARTGQIFLAEQDITNWQPHQREISYVPQEGALFNSMSVEQNLSFALRIRSEAELRKTFAVPQASVSKKELIQKRVAELAEVLSIKPLLKRRPIGLSGGERQRVALGRALSHKPKILCLDEPLSSLDEQTRYNIIELLKKIHLETTVTVLHVTHNQKEVDLLADHQLKIIDHQFELIKSKNNSIPYSSGSLPTGRSTVEQSTVHPD